MNPITLYQTWKTMFIPTEFQKYQNMWINYIYNSNIPLTYNLLTDNDLRNLISEHFPNYLDKYDSFTHNIERVDFARYVMMYLGGIYADLDTYPVKSLNKWILQNKIILGREPLEHSQSIYGRKTVLCNAFMISPPKQQFWIDLMNFILDNYEHNYDPVYNTGPMAMTLFYEKYPYKFNNVIITDPCVFFPLTGKGTITKGCDINKDSYVVHVWTNTWVNKQWWKDPRIFNTRYWFYGLLSLFIFLWLYLFMFSS